MDAGELRPRRASPTRMVRDRLAEADAAAASCSTATRAPPPRWPSSTRCSPRRGDALDAVVELAADTDEVVARLLKRAQIEGRADDTEDVIRHRLEVYAEQTAPAGRASTATAACSSRSTAWARSTRSPSASSPRCRLRGLTAASTEPTDQHGMARRRDRVSRRLSRCALMRRGRAGGRRRPGRGARRGRAGRHHRTSSTPWRARTIRERRRHPVASWATATRRSRRRSASRSTTRSCTASPARGCSTPATSSRSTAGRSWTAGTATPRSRWSVGRTVSTRARSQLLRGYRGSRCGAGIAAMADGRRG